jgi:hypothetical protein
MTMRWLIALALLAVFLLCWFWMKTPRRNDSITALPEADTVLRTELVADVQALAGEIGERNIPQYSKLNAAADFIEISFARAGLKPRRDTYEVAGRACHNLEVEIRGARPEVLVIGAHYDSVFGSPGANDNGSGVAALLALARASPENPADRPCASLPS